MRPGWNPTRRNRNIGTVRQGHGQDNRLVIPRAWPDDRVFWEVIPDAIALPETIGEWELTFLVQPTTPGFVHPCTPEDVRRVLSLVPQEHLDGVELIIWRQPTRKQVTVRPVWGRLVYYACTGRHRGTAIYLEAQEVGRAIHWDRSMTPDIAEELERLREDGHPIDSGKRKHVIRPTLESARATQLYRTLLHELGHYVDWLESVLNPSLEIDDEAEERRISDAYWSKPKLDKESFAHRYAKELGDRLREAGAIPFPREWHPDPLDPHPSIGP